MGHRFCLCSASSNKAQKTAKTNQNCLKLNSMENVPFFSGGRLSEKSEKMLVQVQRVATSKLFRLHCFHGGGA